MDKMMEATVEMNPTLFTNPFHYLPTLPGAAPEIVTFSN